MYEKYGFYNISQNKQVLQPHNKNNGCNCRKKENHSIDNKYITRNIIYKAEVTNNTKDEHKNYLGAAETSFSEGYSNHMQDFKHQKYMKYTNFSTFI